MPVEECNIPKDRMISQLPPRPPLNGTFELTVRCNLKCKMCLFRHDDRENPYLIAHEMSTDEWISMARQISDAGTFTLLITGGEPMLRPDFCEIWEGIYQQGFLMQLYTNATLVSDKIMETLRKYPPHRIGVTLYGASAETYEKVCGNGKAFDMALNGMRRLKTLPSIMEFRTTIINDNKADIDAMEELIRQEFGPDTLLTCARMVNKAVRGACADVEKVRMSPEENVRFIFRKGIRQVKNKVGEAFDYDNLQIRLIEQEKRPSNTREFSLFGCDAGMKEYTISWDGKLLGCQLLGTFSTDARTQGFLKAWNSYPLNVQLMPFPAECQKCKFLDKCSSCYATRFAETGNLCTKPEYPCKDTRYMMNLMKRSI